MVNKWMCSKCMFFQPTAGFHSDGRAGECRRIAPAVRVESLRAVFPRVEADMWCGEYRKDET